ncbi:MAG TPA: FHA domain-containing protein [Candidatus Acidoferrum sp.]|nr:FHA domain-containing protein [Candidatus Acidoferrum sp.]
MAKLVILNQGMTGRTFDLSVERTTVGRVEDNTFQIADGSVSSHHAEIILRGPEIFVKDLNSTNGCFIGAERITESVLKPGQILRLGQVEMRIDDGSPVTAPPPPAPVKPAGTAPAPASPPAPAPTASSAPAGSKKQDATMVIPRGVSLTDLEQGGARQSTFSTSTAFSKKKNKVNLWFIVGGIVVALVIVVLIIMLLGKVHGGSN